MSNDVPEVSRLVLGPLQTNCYLVICPTTRAAMVIDPADQAQRIVKAVQEKNARVEQILLTHGHPDHLAALPSLREATGARVLAHRLDADLLEQYGQYYGLSAQQIPQLLPDVRLEGGEAIAVGSLSGAIIHTPGHTPGGVTLRVGDLLFTGDTLFCRGVGRTDLPGGDLKKLMASIQQLFTLPADCVVYPGHGPSSTIGAEKRDNPYVS